MNEETEMGNSFFNERNKDTSLIKTLKSIEFPEIPYSIPILESKDNELKYIPELEANTQNLYRKCDLFEENCYDIFKKMLELESDSRKCEYYSKLTDILSDSTSSHINRIYESHERKGLFTMIQNIIKNFFQ